MVTENSEQLTGGEQIVVPQPAEQVASQTPQVTEEDVEKYLDSLDDTRASQLAPINRRVKGFMDKLDKQYRDRQKQEQQQLQAQWVKRNEAQAWLAQVQSLTEAEQARVLMVPQNARRYAESVEILQTQVPGGFVKPEEIAAQIWENAKQQLSEHEHFKDVDWAEVEAKAPAEAFSSLILAGSEKRVKRMEEELKKNIAKEVEAAVKAQLAAFNAQASEPERLEPAGGPSSGMTFQQYLNLSAEARAKLTPEEIDRAVANR